MHRTTCKRHFLGWGLLVALLLIGPPSLVRAQTAPGAALIVPINGTVKLQMSTKKPIKSVNNPKDTAISIRTVVGDPTTVLVTGQAPDVTRVELVDEDGKKETYEIIVQLDIEYLRTQLRRAVPTSNVTPIPTSNNSVILAGTVTKAEDVDVILRVAQSIGGIQVINALRVGGVQQVQLDVVIAQVSRSQFRRMAFNFLDNSRNTYFGSTVGQAVSNPPLAGATSATLNATLGGQLLTGASGAPNGAPVNLLGGVLHNSWGFLFFMQALRDEGVLKLMAEPRLTTLSGRPASFLAGGEQAIPVPAGLGQVGVQFEEFGTRLNFLPIVLGNGRIHLEVEPEVSDLNPANGTSIGGTVVPGRSTNRVNTTVQLEDGQTFVIGGLIQHRVRASASKVPILGDIPFINTMFSSKSYEEIEDEVVIMVTPHLVDGQSCDQVLKILPGQETRSPDDFELFLEGILEAPRGQRQVFQGHQYVPAYKNSPTADTFPCGGSAYSCGKGCGTNCGAGAKCGPNGCGTVGVPAVSQPGMDGFVVPPEAVQRLAPPASPEIVKVGDSRIEAPPLVLGTQAGNQSMPGAREAPSPTDKPQAQPPVGNSAEEAVQRQGEIAPEVIFTPGD